MKKLISTLFLVIFLAVFAYNVSYAKFTFGKAEPSQTYSKSKMELFEAMRTFLDNNVDYTRHYIISSVANLSDADTIAKKLENAQEDIGSAIKPFYGSEASNRLSELLKANIVIATEVVAAAKQNSKDSLNNAKKKWTENSDKIAAFLSSVNPNWSKKDLTNLLHKHLELTTDEIVARAKGNWSADLKYYEKGKQQMVKLADMLSQGIAKQFPDRFK